MKAMVLLAAALAAGFAQAEVSIEWDRPVEVARGYYARVHRLQDGRYMCVYSHKRNACAKFSDDGLRTWSEERIVARGFDVTNAAGRVTVALDNAEFVQLKSGRIVYGVNLRPAGQLYEVSPSAIGVTVSDDAGATWSPLKVVYRAPVLPDGVRRGCWEPFFLELPDGTVQLYFADESPYVDGRRKYQEITVMDSRDGLDWTNRRAASYAPKCRDGMPVAIVEGDQILLAIESNPPKHHLFPQIVRTSVADPWKTPVGDPSSDRCRPLADAADFRTMKAGAPYLAASAAVRSGCGLPGEGRRRHQGVGCQAWLHARGGHAGLEHRQQRVDEDLEDHLPGQAPQPAHARRPRRHRERDHGRSGRG